MAHLLIHGGDRPLLTVGLGLNQECLVRVGSPNHPEYVPALCTHRPSLLSMNSFVRLRDCVYYTRVILISHIHFAKSDFALRIYTTLRTNLFDQMGLKEREVVTRQQQVNLLLDHYTLTIAYYHHLLPIPTQSISIPTHYEAGSLERALIATRIVQPKQAYIGY